MPILNRPKKVRIRLLIILAQTMASLWTNTDRDPGLWVFLAKLLEQVDTLVLDTDETNWTSEQEAAWTAAENTLDAFETGTNLPACSSISSLSTALDTAVKAIP